MYLCAFTSAFSHSLVLKKKYAVAFQTLQKQQQKSISYHCDKKIITVADIVNQNYIYFNVPAACIRFAAM